MTIPRPHWFKPNLVMVSTAPTCGISKSGGLLARFDPATGRKVEVADPTTGTSVEAIDDRLLEDMHALRDGRTAPTLHFIEKSAVSLRHAVPVYYDRRYHEAFARAMKNAEFAGFSSATLGELLGADQIVIRGGHGSAPKDLRVGEVPYIKVSDLRAGLVNINPTNRVPLKWAETMWRSPKSGLRAFDLLSPERASRNIGDFCVLMPGQEQIMLTKEIIVLRPGPKAVFDPFYLLWAMTLKIVRDQWHRVVFMQTNREDVGRRYLEIEIPLPPSAQKATEVSEPFRSYFMDLADRRAQLREYLRAGSHHFFLSGVESPDAPLPELNASALETTE